MFDFKIMVEKHDINITTIKITQHNSTSKLAIKRASKVIQKIKVTEKDKTLTYC